MCSRVGNQAARRGRFQAMHCVNSSTDFNLYSPPHQAADAPEAVDAHLDVAVQVAHFESKGLKPVSQCIGSRVETRRFQATGGSTGCNLYSPALMVTDGKAEV
jgi:hypothetical protein